jgi:hypothetical protein
MILLAPILNILSSLMHLVLLSFLSTFSGNFLAVVLLFGFLFLILQQVHDQSSAASFVARLLRSTVVRSSLLLAVSGARGRRRFVVLVIDLPVVLPTAHHTL